MRRQLPAVAVEVVGRLVGHGADPFARQKIQRIDRPVLSADPSDPLRLQEPQKRLVVAFVFRPEDPLGRSRPVVPREMKSEDDAGGETAEPSTGSGCSENEKPER
jgi:hypothetical protein